MKYIAYDAVERLVAHRKRALKQHFDLCGSTPECEQEAMRALKDILRQLTKWSSEDKHPIMATVVRTYAYVIAVDGVPRISYQSLERATAYRDRYMPRGVITQIAVIE